MIEMIPILKIVKDMSSFIFHWNIQRINTWKKVRKIGGSTIRMRKRNFENCLDNYN